ncbi:MAG: Hsp20/alpha crystallin family protein [Acidobacteriia bacterium]|nr:Hsp20/alpha crystallin family protein [Terriglobia bacterium]
MSQVAIKKVNGAGQAALPIFDEIAKRLELVQQRAFDLFEKRGGELGHDQEDWLKAERELFGWPAAELAEKDGTYEMQITLAGFEAKDVEVTAAPTQVIVHAATQEEKKTQKGTVLWTELGSNEVYRRFQVPKLINVDKVTAKLENGMLRISAPEALEATTIAKPREIKTAAA